ncbi:MAG: cation-translocating P-type ATPase [Candidatus Krumholzibacteriota bacterium]|nr:cation-translocating P-type ATPase [Candidatus Krumholzibacteriota bacterium]
MTELRLQIKGFTGGGCARRTEAALRGLPGVTAVAVNPLTGEARVQGPGHLPLLGLLEVMRRRGYEAEPLLDGEERRPGGIAAWDTPALRRDTRLALLVGVPLLLLVRLGPRGLAWDLLAGSLAAAVLAGPGRGIFRDAWQRLRARQPALEILTALALAAAWLSSWLVLPTSGPRLFDVAALGAALALAGRLLAATTARRLAAAATPVDPLPDRARRVDEEGAEREVSLADLKPKDRLRLRPGQIVPADGYVLRGESVVDESRLSGESRFARKGPGDLLIGGTQIHEGFIEMTVAAVGEATVLATLRRLLEQAGVSKSSRQAATDRILELLPLATLGLSLLALLARVLLAEPAPVTVPLLPALAVLLAPSTATLAMALPGAFLVGLGLAARRGILFRDARSIEDLRAITRLALDKTGILTRGLPRVANFEPLGTESSERVFRLVAAAECTVRHPVADALRRYCSERSEATAVAMAQVTRPGGGLKAEVTGRQVLVGAPWYLAGEGVDLAPAANAIADLESSGLTPVLVALDGRLAALFGVDHELHPEARALVQRLRRHGIETLLLSGDRPEAVRRKAERAGIRHFEADLRPEAKARRIRELMAGAERVAMLGDAVGDAPALAAADVDIALVGGDTPPAGTAAVTLLQGNLARVLDAVGAAERTMAVAGQNLTWAVTVNAAAMALGGLGLLPPLAAAAVAAATPLLVLAGSLRLRTGPLHERRKATR